MIVDSENEQDLAYVSSGDATLSASAQVKRGTPCKVTPGVFTSF